MSSSWRSHEVGALRLERILGELPRSDADYLRAYIDHLERSGEDRGAVIGLAAAAAVSGIVWGLVGFALGRWLG
jgi:hypothetical protein